MIKLHEHTFVNPVEYWIISSVIPSIANIIFTELIWNTKS